MKDKTKTKKFNLHHRRDFLNLPFNHSDASINSSISITQDTPTGYIDTDVQFRIRDCNQLVSLSFSYDDYDNGENLNERFKNGIHKIDTLIANLEEFKEAYKKGYTVYKILKKEKEAALKAQKEKRKEPNDKIQ